MTYTCMIVDDEPKSLRLLKHYIDKFNQISVLFTCHSAEEALTIFEKKPVDLVLLDIDMPGMNGIELSSKFPKETKIVFCTAHGSFAIQAFEVSAIDYIIKPYTPKRVEQALTKVVYLLNLEKGLPVEYINLKKNRQNIRVPIQDIVFVKSEEDYCMVKTRTDFFVVKLPLKRLLGSLNDSFLQIQKSYVVNMKMIRSYQASSLETVFGQELPIGRSFRKIFREKIEKI